MISKLALEAMLKCNGNCYELECGNYEDGGTDYGCQKRSAQTALSYREVLETIRDDLRDMRKIEQDKTIQDIIFTVDKLLGECEG